jgi:hypothetical protein
VVLLVVPEVTAVDALPVADAREPAVIVIAVDVPY